MTSVTSTELPLLIAEVEVAAVARLSPSFLRFELASPELADLGVDGPLWDQRLKLVFPDGEGPVPSFEGADESWYSTWLDRPVSERGHMRTYTVRRLLGTGPATRLVIDIVVHGEDDPAHAGPGSSWAMRATLGDRIVVIGPRRGTAYGGIEFDPGTASRLLLVGDETAVPAISAILELLPSRARGAAFLEDPTGSDVLTLEHPAGVGLHWLPRDGAAVGSLISPAVLAHLGAGNGRPRVEDDEIDPDLWETPSYSSSGETVDEAVSVVGHDLDDLYAWIAGESRMVTGLRRVLVKELGMDRRQVAFMGYWREGVSMQS